MLSFSHDHWLIAASLAVALMAGFTGLSLTRGVSQLTPERRKLNIALAAISLGGGIWSMHFIAMLGLQLPIDFFYNPLTTLVSALIAILVVGSALLLLHFWARTAVTITASGALVGIGILAMHYLGMSGIQLCLPLYSAAGVAISIIVSIALSIAAFWIAYGQRTRMNIIFGTILFGLAVFAVHFVAMAGTSFTIVENPSATTSLISNETLAFIVTIGSFIICGAFLLNGVTFLPDRPQLEPEAKTLDTSPTPAIKMEELTQGLEASSKKHATDKPEVSSNQIPYEKNGKIYFIDYANVAAIRAEGHYTLLYSGAEKLFCPWSISDALKRLPANTFVKTHRSYLINPALVSEFERRKDNGICYFDSTPSLEKVPVSRTRLPAVRKSLGLI